MEQCEENSQENDDVIIEKEISKLTLIPQHN